MTPAINFLEKQKIVFSTHLYEVGSSTESYGLEAAHGLKVSPEIIFKTLVVSIQNNKYAVAIIPVSQKLSMKSLAKAVGAKKAEMADGEDVERMTGYVLGGVSPLGQKKRFMTVIDESAKDKTTVYISGGKRGLEIEISPEALCKCLSARYEKIVV